MSKQNGVYVENANSLLRRVPEVTILFWVIKVLSTTVGETGADYLSETIGLGLPKTTIIIGIAFVVALANQFRLKRYTPVSYWTVVVLTSIEGTLITDYLVDDLGVSLITIGIIFSIAMLIGFFIWYKKEKSLSIHTINTVSRERYYWLIIILAFALGTAGGDIVSEYIGLGYALSLGIFATMTGIIIISFYNKKGIAKEL